MTRFFLVPDSRSQNLEEDLKKIVDYLISFVGEIEVSYLDRQSATIHYVDTNILSTLKIAKNQIELWPDEDDAVSVNLIKNISRNLGLRIFNPQTLSYSLNDPLILEVATENLNPLVAKIIKRYKLTPLFNYRDSLVFFAQDKTGKIHLINRHLLEFLKDSPPDEPLPKKDFSVVVAQDIGHFVALFDRGVIPLSYYKCVDAGVKITNLSGFDIEKLKRDVSCEIIPFYFDPARQTFNQAESKIKKIKKGKNLVKSLGIHNFLALKIQTDITYSKTGKRLIPNLRVSVFLDN